MRTTKTMLTATTLGALLAVTMPMAASAHGMGKYKGQHMGQDFTTLDTDNSGEITLAEMEAARAASFAQIDADGDGSLTAEELLESAGHEGRAERRVQKMIRWMDENENGTVELAEMSAKDKRLEKRFSRMDADASGGISEAEFADGQGCRGKGHRDKNEQKT